MVIMKNPAFLGEDGKPRNGTLFVLKGADFNVPRQRPQILEIPDSMMDPDFYPLQVGWPVVAYEEEEGIGLLGTITEIFRAGPDRFSHRPEGQWLCKVMLDD